jgi:hypothetical protein
MARGGKAARLRTDNDHAIPCCIFTINRTAIRSRHFVKETLVSLIVILTIARRTGLKALKVIIRVILLNPHDARARLRVHVSLGGAARRERCR